MANVYLQDSTLTAIADAIRTKGGTTEQLLPSEMPAAITNLPSGGDAERPYDVFKMNAKGESGRGWQGWKTYFPTNDDFDKIKMLILVTTSNGRSMYIKENPTWATYSDGSVRVEGTFFEYSGGDFTVSEVYKYDTSKKFCLSFDADNFITFRVNSDEVTWKFGSPTYCGVYLEKYR